MAAVVTHGQTEIFAEILRKAMLSDCAKAEAKGAAAASTDPSEMRALQEAALEVVAMHRRLRRMSWNISKTTPENLRKL